MWNTTNSESEENPLVTFVNTLRPDHLETPAPLFHVANAIS